jgi:hypothetical protein
MRRSRDVVDFQLGVIAIFSIGYFCLPVWFKQLSPLQYYKDGVIAKAVLLFFLFALFVVFGTWAGRLVVPVSVAFRTGSLDAVLDRNRRWLVVAAFLWYAYYYSTNELTSYAAQDFEAYFKDDGAFSAITAGTADIALGWIALNVALALRDRRRREFWLYLVLLGTCVVMLLFVGQRLAILSPIAMLMASLALTGQMKQAGKTLFLGVAALLLVSPVAVAVREAPVNVSAEEAVSTFDYGDAPIETIFQSIIDRGDLLYVAIEMMPRIDADPLPGFAYYGSVLVNPVPSVLFPGGSKPYLLSTNGTASGELSIYAWQSLHSSDTGSLSAFGGLVAYRELGWTGVPVNGLLTGLLFLFLYRWLGQGGLLCMVCYSSLFVSLSVKKVPPSFWEALSELMPLLPTLLAAFLLEKVLTSNRHAKPNAGVEPA